ncbi:DNA methylase N-4/N-6 domain protein [Candidatus Magnetobacterium bavaricum]|uniref:site-specific DNA-methyltransferase (cytosine-N(4)-specific) n=1 Tax=Candidatus Magnetobacterium bavaricum TaxID=29290 RepID=A0A0F3GRB4_9BACT|nr:DNA methylase N-4/N-6 domain protein [Candidatus Magnetobacterium bavaricum]
MRYWKSVFTRRLGKAFFEADRCLIYNMDCMKGLRNISAASVDLTVTSPPYNIGKEYEKKMPLEDYIDWVATWVHEIYRITKQNGAFLLNLGHISILNRATAMPIAYLIWDKVPFFLVQEIIWNYGGGVIAHKRLDPRNEKWLWYVKNKSNYVFNLDEIREPNVKYPNQKRKWIPRTNTVGKNPSDVWEIAKVSSGTWNSRERTAHPAQFPVDLITRIVKGFSNKNQVILDPFMGSGTTAEVAIREGRHVIGFEIREDYCKIIEGRLNKVLHDMNTNGRVDIADEQMQIENIEAVENRKEERYNDGTANIKDKIQTQDIELIYDNGNKAILDIIKLAEKLNIFNDQKGEVFTFFDGRVTPICERDFSDLLVRQYFDTFGTLPSSNAIKKSVTLISANAKHKAESVDLSLRIFENNGVIYYDLGDGRVVKVNGYGWSIEPAKPMFYSYPHHQRVQVEPVRGGDIWNIFKYLNVTEELRLLLLCYIVTIFIPNIIRPILYVTGGEGTGKSTLCRVLKDLVDPCRVEFISISGNERDMLYNLFQNYYVIFDDVLDITSKQLDLLMGSANEYGFNKRNRGNGFVHVPRRAVAMNGSKCVVCRPDIADRILILPSGPIEEGMRTSEGEFWIAFKKDEPLIFGAILDVLSASIYQYQTIREKFEDRVVDDFAVFGAAVAVVIGRSYEEFLEMYEINNQLKVKENRLLQAVVRLMADKERYDDFISTFYTAIMDEDNEMEGDKTFPRAATKIMRAMEMIKPNLNAHNITFYKTVTNKGNRISIIKKNDT